jgi:hypothetical protein|tara:strand:- start:185 stop:376 length:192 start_codon:yes stop_codon:yes gene_type:complete
MPEKNAPTLHPKANLAAYPMRNPATAADAQPNMGNLGIGCDKPFRQNAAKNEPTIRPIFVNDV